MNETQNIRKLQATLLKIKTKSPCFFNIGQFISIGLVKEHGLTLENKTNWILTEKANQLLSVMV